MKVTDLTHIIYSSMPVFPGTEGPLFQKANTIEKDGFQEVKITMYSHTGTHIDAPAHMLQNGLYLDDFEIDKFIGKGVILDFSDSKESSIELDSLRSYEEKIKNAEFIILKTGWSKYWGDEKYYADFPALSEEAAKWLARFKLKGIGIDAISIDNMNTETFPVHKIFLAENILIIENLTNLESIMEEAFILSIMPLKNKAADGSPVRAFCIEDEV
ncbi:cyclase family protein [Desulfosporosinus nitroreducens]|uniref:Cyclase family protein n=1 Tax=Desulfosporosinus nitroreducens TaxID=2018668 RepID=A0ABT8QLW9_9FIRM|nr:cyclase family protein [Desulfosporosinus nitroreducens]MDO0822352.1 cyclase family protein [Desulfosporosinus nitroreducens]